MGVEIFWKFRMIFGDIQWLRGQKISFFDHLPTSTYVDISSTESGQK